LIEGDFNKHGTEGRSLDIAGGSLTVNGGTYTSTGTSAGTNFMSLGMSSKCAFSGIRMVNARYQESIINSGAVTCAFTSTTQQWVSVNPAASLVFTGSVTGLATQPSGTYTTIPNPTLPAFAQ